MIYDQCCDQGSIPETEAEAKAPGFEAEAETVAFETEAVDPKTEAEAARQYVNKSHT